MSAITLNAAGDHTSLAIERHLRLLATLETDSDSFLHGVVERLVRPAGEAATEATSKRSRTQDDLALSTEAVMIEMVRRKLSKSQIAADLSAVGVESAETLAATLYSIVDDRRNEIERALAKRTSLISAGTLEDFDWSLRMVMGSDQLSTLRQPLLLLSLTIRNTNGQVVHKTLELDKERLDSMLKSFGSIHEVLSNLS
jgi:hypothetical protein|tara:strand:- start:192 stop:788 length:597 start_codon:yes stop_codon:yes gene_type:complete